MRFEEALISPDIERRVLVAYHRRCVRDGTIYEQPAGGPDCWSSGDGRRYVVLANVRGILAVYRQRSDGERIAYVKEPPRALLRHYRHH